MRLRHLLFLSFFIPLIGCGGDPVGPPLLDDSKEYNPFIVGKFIDYQVDSIVFDDAPGGNKKDTIRFQLREQVMSYNIFIAGDTLYYLHRFRREHAGQNWVLKDVWTTHQDENNILRTEENLTFRKMTFPLRKGLRWIGTGYISPLTEVRIGTEILEPYQYWESRVLEIDEAGEVGDFIFPVGHVMRISQTDTDDEATKRFVHETYVRNIGLVSRQDTILDSRCLDLGDFTTCFGKPWLIHASKGYILSQVMIDHN